MKWLKKARELVVGEEDRKNGFARNCDTVLGIVTPLPAFERSMRLIISDLQAEASDNDSDCLDYLVENEVARKIADKISPTIKSEYLDAILRFFAYFVTPEYSQHLCQIAIHSAVAVVMSQMEFLDRKCPRDARPFVTSLCERVESNPIIIELLFCGSGAEKTLPLLDYLASAVVSTSESGTFARDFIQRVFFAKTTISRQYGSYLRTRLYPILVSLLFSIAGYCQTIQFEGSVTKILNWCERLFLFDDDFPIEKVFERLACDSSPSERFSAMSFFLSRFVGSETIRLKAITSCIQNRFVDLLVESFASPDECLVRSAMSMVLLLLNFECGRIVLLPPFCETMIDVMYLVPASWFERESWWRPVSDSVVCARKGREGGQSGSLYMALLRILARFGELEQLTCEAFVKLMTVWFAMAPDLMNRELADALVEAVTGGEVRRVMIIRFVKDMHEKFVAAAKLVTT